MSGKLDDLKSKTGKTVKKTAVFLWKQKMLVPAILMGAFVCVSLYSYEKPKFQKPDTVIAAEQDELPEDIADLPEETSGEGFDLEDGTYTGSGTGYGGTVTVEVTIKDKKIESIRILSAPGEGESFLSRAKGVIDAMIKKQSTDVDTVSGATYSSRGIIEAVKNALTGEKSTSAVAAPASAQKGSPGSVGTVKENQTYKDGTYTGSAQGFGGTIKVEVTIKNGKIKSIKVLSASGETKSYFDKAKKLLNTMVKKQSTNVDAVSGATYSSNGIIKAVRNALAKAKADGSEKKTNKKSSSSKPAASGKLPYPDGVYYGTGEGFAGPITVAITIRDHTLKSAVITESEDDDEFLSKAKSILDAVVTRQSAKVDAVSGATYSSKGIIEAIKNALKAAKKAASGQDKKDPDQNGSVGDNSGEEVKEGTVYKNGTYTGSALCDDGETFSYTLEVKITVQADKITAVEIVNSTDEEWLDNERYITRAKNIGVGRIITKGLPEGIDAVSGATYSSNALYEACRTALAKAKK